MMQNPHPNMDDWYKEYRKKITINDIKAEDLTK
jgi:hypothetical protein